VPANHYLLAVITSIFLIVTLLTALVPRVLAVLQEGDDEAPLLFPIYLPGNVQSSGLLMLLVHLIQLITAFMARAGLIGAQLHFMVLMIIATKNLVHLNTVLRTLQTDE
jgi:hypothetical protein